MENCSHTVGEEKPEILESCPRRFHERAVPSYWKLDITGRGSSRTTKSCRRMLNEERKIRKTECAESSLLATKGSFVLVGIC